MKILSGDKPNLDIVNFENLNQVITEVEEINNGDDEYETQS